MMLGYWNKPEATAETFYELVDAQPRNASGKLLKPKLREQFPGPAPF